MCNGERRAQELKQTDGWMAAADLHPSFNNTHKRTKFEIYLDGLKVARLLLVSQQFPLRAMQTIEQRHWRKELFACGAFNLY